MAAKYSFPMNDLSLRLNDAVRGAVGPAQGVHAAKWERPPFLLAGDVTPPIAHAIDDGCILLRREFWEPVPPLIKSYFRNRTCPPFRGDDSSMQLHLQRLSPDFHAAYLPQDIHRAPFVW